MDFRIQQQANNLETLVEWDASDDQMRKAWANEIDATEAGAYACALAALELSVGLVAVRRAETRTGADYYVATPDTEVEDLENCQRLEVSGVNTGSHYAVEERLRAKIAQAARGRSNLPALAGIVGFREKLIRLEHL